MGSFIYCDLHCIWWCAGHSPEVVLHKLTSQSVNKKFAEHHQVSIKSAAMIYLQLLYFEKSPYTTDQIYPSTTVHEGKKDNRSRDYYLSLCWEIHHCPITMDKTLHQDVLAGKFGFKKFRASFVRWSLGCLLINVNWDFCFYFLSQKLLQTEISCIILPIDELLVR